MCSLFPSVLPLFGTLLPSRLALSRPLFPSRLAGVVPCFLVFRPCLVLCLSYSADKKALNIQAERCKAQSKAAMLLRGDAPEQARGRSRSSRGENEGLPAAFQQGRR